jgi:hypothetical protein
MIDRTPASIFLESNDIFFLELLIYHGYTLFDNDIYEETTFCKLYNSKIFDSLFYSRKDYIINQFRLLSNKVKTNFLKEMIRLKHYEYLLYIIHILKGDIKFLVEEVFVDNDFNESDFGIILLMDYQYFKSFVINKQNLIFSDNLFNHLSTNEIILIEFYITANTKRLIIEMGLYPSTFSERDTIIFVSQLKQSINNNKKYFLKQNIPANKIFGDFYLIY